MPAKTPSVFTATAAGTTYVDTRREVYSTSLSRAVKTEDLSFEVHYFADIDDGDTWTSGIDSLVAVAWQDEDPTSDTASAVITTQATGVVTFKAGAANGSGWLWLFRARR